MRFDLLCSVAEALQNISAACCQRGMRRTEFYNSQHRDKLQSLEGLNELPSINRNHV